MQMFLKNMCLRNSCYDCPAKGLERVSDITVADFWGIQNEYPDFDDDQGTSLIIVHNLKIIDFLVEVCKVKEIDLNKGLKYNYAMLKSVAKAKPREHFFKDLNKLTFEKMIKKYVILPWYKKSYLSAKRLGRKIIRMIGLKR